MKKTFEEVKEALENAKLTSDSYSPRMQRLLQGIANIRRDNSNMDESIFFFEELSRKEEIQIFYFGGFLRDAYLGLMPRDLDIVVNNGFDRFEQITSSFLVRKNRFGGLKLKIGETPIDSWDVTSTDAFNRGVTLPASLVRLPETTIFNAESIVLEVWAPQGDYWGWERGFFDACETRTLELQNPWNTDFQESHVALQLARVYNLQRKLGWGIGPDLKRYIKRSLPRINASDVKREYESHYGEPCEQENVLKYLNFLVST